MKKQSPAISKAEKYILKFIENKKMNAGDFLPSIATLSKSSKISPVTMWKAVHRLSESNILEIVHGQGTKLKESQEISYLNDIPQKGWQGLYDKIHKDILCGIYSPGTTIPSIKELENTYGASYQTIKKALDKLCSNGILDIRFRKYHVIHHKKLSPNLSIVLLGWYHETLEMQQRTPWGTEFLRYCEQQCSRIGYELKVLRFTNNDESIRFIDQNDKYSSAIPLEDSIEGYILMAESPDHLYNKVLSQLERTKKPVAVLQEGSQIDVSGSNRKNNLIQLFSIATSSTAAKQIATFLIQSGHSATAFISPYHKANWSRARYLGLNEIYSRYGSDIQSYTINTIGTSWEYGLFIKSPESYFDSIISFMSNQKFPSIIHKSLETYRNSFVKNIEFTTIKKILTPLLEKALSTNCSAWVCANDFVALYALEFLKTKTKRKIALIGFDDTFEAFRNGLTSYNFNIEGIVQVMIAYILNPSSVPSRKRNSAIEIEGMLVERKTTFKKLK
jgi:DNA-binding GntR family transcriptional regulator